MRYLMFSALLAASLVFAGCSSDTSNSDSNVGVGEGAGISVDTDASMSLCGNGQLDEDEKCDIAIPVPLEGCCPFAELCVDEDPCTVDKLINDNTCLADCDFSEEVAPSMDVNDSCCPTGATSANDADCSDSCGNGVVDDGESCDPGLEGSCPTSCQDDGDACTTQSLVTADPCNPVCETTDIIEQVSGDGCCPDGATMETDSDCESMGELCGNGTVGDGENCDTAIESGEEGSCPRSEDCIDEDPCTVDAVDGAGTCSAVCDNSEAAVANLAVLDQCCPPGATDATDADCEPAPPTCGDGSVGDDELCDTGITSGPGACPTSCDDDGNACTVETLSGSMCNVSCTTSTISTPSNGDGCCPEGGNANNDNDCSAVCGNGIVEGNEECDGGTGCQNDCTLAAVTPDPISKDIDGACSNTFNGAFFSLPVTLNVAPNGPISGGQAFSADITPSVTLTEDFIGGVLEVLTTLTEVTVQFGQATITARSGATGGDVLSVLPGTPFVQNILEDPNGNSLPGPITITFETVTGNYTAAASGNVVFDFVGDPESAPAPGATGLATQILGVINVGLPCGSGVLTDVGGELMPPVTPHPDADVISFPIN